MTIAVTGANGFVGRRFLATAGATIGTIPLVRRPSGLPAERVVGEFTSGILDPSALEGAEILVHLAARTHVLRETASDPLAAYREVNVEGTRNLLTAAQHAGVRHFVYMSSIKASGEWTREGEPFTPDTPTRPEDPYGQTKLEAEQLVRETCERNGMQWTIIRPPLIYGPGVQANLARLARLIVRGIPLPFGQIRNRRSLIYVDNLAEATLHACTAPSQDNRLLLLCDTTLSTPDLVRALAKALDRQAKLFPVPMGTLQLLAQITGRGEEIQRLCGSLEVDPTASMAALDWQPSYSMEEAMRASFADLGASKE